MTSNHSPLYHYNEHYDRTAEAQKDVQNLVGTKISGIVRIGNGAYGTVFKGTENNCGDAVALKHLSNVSTTQNGISLAIMREIFLLKRLAHFDHENVMRLQDVMWGDNCMVMVFPFLEFDLSTYMEKHRPHGIGGRRIRELLKQMLLGLDFLHMHKVVHRDIKPQNILVSKDHKVKIADFGLSRIVTSTNVLTPVVVTVWYRGPEVLLEQEYDSKVDIWSIGCIMAEMYRLEPLFQIHGNSDANQLRAIFSFLGIPPEEKWPMRCPYRMSMLEGCGGGKPVDEVVPQIREDEEACELLRWMLQFDGRDRPTATQATKHAYFNLLNPFHIPLQLPSPCELPLVENQPSTARINSRCSTQYANRRLSFSNTSRPTSTIDHNVEGWQKNRVKPRIISPSMTLNCDESNHLSYLDNQKLGGNQHERSTSEASNISR